MKKTILVVFAVVLIAAAAVYLIIPSKLNFNYKLRISASETVASKFLIYKNGWAKWWPGSKTGKGNYTYKGAEFIINELTNSGAIITIKKAGVTFNSEITYQAEEDGKITIQWNGKNQNSSAFALKMSDYKTIAGIEYQIQAILLHFKNFTEDQKNAYGYQIHSKTVTEITMLTTTTQATVYPSVPVVYAMIKLLKQQVAAAGAKETNYPMMNVTSISAKEYQITVAIPINKKIPPANSSFINTIPTGGTLLVADVRGGTNTTINALAQVKIYMKDHRLVSPAMPFESLITDRSVEKDTSKWITKIYYPIL